MAARTFGCWIGIRLVFAPITAVASWLSYKAVALLMGAFPLGSLFNTAVISQRLSQRLRRTRRDRDHSLIFPNLIAARIRDNLPRM
jgi:hypothetical protein